jgi:hypothetical protein
MTKLHRYEIYINEESTPDRIVAASPREAIENYCIGEQDSNFMFTARRLHIVGPKTDVTLPNVEFYVEDMSLYSEYKLIERIR